MLEVVGAIPAHVSIQVWLLKSVLKLNCIYHKFSGVLKSSNRFSWQDRGLWPTCMGVPLPSLLSPLDVSPFGMFRCFLGVVCSWVGYRFLFCNYGSPGESSFSRTISTDERVWEEGAFTDILVLYWIFLMDKIKGTLSSICSTMNSRPLWPRHIVLWFSWHDSVQSKVGLGYIRGLFQS